MGYSSQANRERKRNYFKRLVADHNILCLQEVHGKDEFLQALQVLTSRFLFFGTFIPGNENAGGSAICIHKDLLTDNATVTHIVTCPGRDHIVSVQSERTKLVIVKFHFEPELTVRRLRERLRLIVPQWPSYPLVLALSLVTSIFATPKKEDSTRFSPIVILERPLLCISISRTFLNSQNLITPGGTHKSVASFVPYLELIGSLSTCRWTKCVTFTITHTFLRSWITGQFRAITQRCVWSFKNPIMRGDNSNAFLNGCPNNHFCSFLKRVHDGHRYSDEPFRALDVFKTIGEQDKKQTFREIERKTPGLCEL